MVSRFRAIILSLVRQLFLAIDGVLLSKKSFEILINQRDTAISNLTSIESRLLTVGIAGVVVSKDRALQLHSLLSTYLSLASNPAPLTIIYTASNSGHKESYREIEKIFSIKSPLIKFIEEESTFKTTLKNVLKDFKVKNIFFLVDDNVFIRKIDLAFAANVDASEYVLSLRHSPHLTRSYTSNRRQVPPPLKKFGNFEDLLEFSWFEAGCEWSDPWSLDGHVLSTAEVKAITDVSNFSAPNSYEAALKTFNSLCKERKGLCYFESKILNLPINRIQNEFQNLSGSISTDFLLAQWNRGLIFDTSRLLTYTPQSPHEELNLDFINRLT